MAKAVDGRFPRLSYDGQRVACGALVVSIEGVPVGPGTTPVWVDNESILYTRQPDGALMLGGAGRTPVELRPAGHEPSSLCCDGRGRFAFRDASGVWTSDRQLTVPGAFRPTWAGLDLCWCIDTGSTADLYREGQLVARTVHDVRGMPDGRLCFVKVDGAEQWACIQHPTGLIESWRLLGAQEYHPQVFDFAGDVWVLSHTRDDRLLLRTGNNGVLVHAGATFEPDAAVRATGILRLVWANDRGVLVDRLLTTLTPTSFRLSGDGMDPETRIVRDLRATPAPAVAPFPPGAGWTQRPDITTVNVKDVMFGHEYSLDGLPAGVTPVPNVVYSHPIWMRKVAENVFAIGKQFADEDGDGTKDVQIVVLTCSDTHRVIGMPLDRTDGKRKNGGYALRNRGSVITAPLYDYVMTVGAWVERPVQVVTLATGKGDDHVWRGRVQSVWTGPCPWAPGTSCRWVCLEWDFAHKGYIEETWYALDEQGKGRGHFMWFEKNESTGAMRRHFGWSPFPNPPALDVPAAYVTRFPRPPVAEPVPEPEPDPMAKTREQLMAEFTAVHEFYKAEEGLQRPGGIVIPDENGVPSTDIQAVRQWLCDLVFGSTVDQIKAQIRQSDEWKAKHPAAPVPEPEPGEPGSDADLAPRGPFRYDRRVVRNHAGALVDWREVGGFTLHDQWLLYGGDAMAYYPRLVRAVGGTFVRVMLGLGANPWWQARRRNGQPVVRTVLDDRTYDSLPAFCEWLASFGLGVRVCYIGALDFGGPIPDRKNHYTAQVKAWAERHVTRTAQALRGVSNVIGEIANEYNQIGFGADAAAVIALGRISKAHAPDLLLCGSNDNGPNADAATFMVAPFDYNDPHFDRRNGYGGFEWVKRTSESPAVDGELPCHSGEPINFGSPAPGKRDGDDNTRSTAVALAYGATSRMKRYSTNYHCDAALNCDPFDDATMACANAWRLALDTIPLNPDASWQNGHWAESPWHVSNFPSADDNEDTWPKVIRIFGRSDGFWVSIGHRRSHEAALRSGRTVTLLAVAEFGDYQCRIWRA